MRDNMNDRDRKGRRIAPLGKTNGRAKLTDENVASIRDLISQGVSQQEIGTRFGVNQTNVSFISRRKNWAHI